MQKLVQFLKNGKRVFDLTDSLRILFFLLFELDFIIFFIFVFDFVMLKYILLALDTCLFLFICKKHKTLLSIYLGADS